MFNSIDDYLFFVAITIIVCFIVFYTIIKKAVKDGVIEAYKEIKNPTPNLYVTSLKDLEDMQDHD